MLPKFLSQIQQAVKANLDDFLKGRCGALAGHRPQVCNLRGHTASGIECSKQIAVVLAGCRVYGIARAVKLSKLLALLDANYLISGQRQFLRELLA